MIVRLLIASCFCFVLGAVVRWDSADYRRFLNQMKAAWTMAGISFKQRATAMGLHPSQMSRIESGELRLHADRIAMLGAEYPSFYQFLAIVLVRDYGMSPEGKAAAELTRRTA